MREWRKTIGLEDVIGIIASLLLATVILADLVNDAEVESILCGQPSSLIHFFKTVLDLLSAAVSIQRSNNLVDSVKVCTLLLVLGYNLVELSLICCSPLSNECRSIMDKDK